MMLKAKSPVFVVGSARSGTSLVYSILLATNKFALYPAETLLLRTCADKYGKLSHSANYKRFINDWLSSKQFIRSGLDRNQFIADASRHNSSYLDFLDFFMTSVAEKQGKACWAENTPNHVLEITNIAEYFPQARFIHVIRDGRAVAASLNKLGWVSCKHPDLRLMSAGLHWQTQVITGRRQGRKIGHRYMELQYEELVCQPENALRKLSEFIGVCIDMQKLQLNPHGSLGKSNSVYGKESNDGNLLSKESLAKWKTILSIDEQAMLNSLVGDTLHCLGYSVEERKSAGWISVMYCKFVYHLKEWLRHGTILGRKSKSGLELDGI